MNHGSLFSGDGGFDLASEWMGWENVFHCEWNPFGKKILKHYWPNAKSYNDITKTDFTIHRGSIDILTGGFPCQPYSTAGKRRGKQDDRHLWPEMLRAIREIQPTWVVGENVRGLVNWSDGLVFNEVQSDLENEGYEVFPFLLPACAVNAPHKRERIWFVAYSNSNTTGSSGKSRSITSIGGKNNDEPEFGRKQTEQYNRSFEFLQNATDTERDGGRENNRIRKSRFFDQTGAPTDWQNFPTQSPICIGNDGISAELDGITFSKWRNESIKAAGNAIVPQVALMILKSIQEYETMQNL